MTATEIIERLRTAGIALRMHNDKVYVGENAPEWALEAIRGNREAVVAHLRLEEQVAHARRLQHALDYEGRRELVGDFRKILATIEQTEATLRRWGVSGDTIRKIIEGVPRAIE